MLNLDELNDAQRQAVLYCSGPSLVIAGAGSGKTRVLTYKIAYLISQGIAPSSILALTFTNKAAQEMKSRIAAQVGHEQAQRVWGGTFHSIFARILHTESQYIGFSSNFTIYDAADSKSLIKNIIKEMQLDDKVYRPASVQARISAAKNRLLLPAAYMADAELCRADSASRMPLIGRIYERYLQRCRQADVMDFDDLLLFTFLLFQNNPDVLERYQERFQYLLVDEYQDTNHAQHNIVWQLTRRTQNLCVVGDDAQSIYSFRGANINNILSFNHRYPGARLFKLEQNYRSTQNIVGAANSLIKHNQGQIPKAVFSEKERGKPLCIFEAASDLVEAQSVAKRIEQLHSLDHIAYSEIAILYRANAQSRQFEEAFRKRGIPYRIFGGLAFYQRKEIKDIMAYFRLAVNPNDEEALRRVINYPTRGIGQTTLQRLTQVANESNASLWSVLQQPAAFGCVLGSAVLAHLKSFVQLISSFCSDTHSVDAATLAKRIFTESGVQQDVFRGRDPEDISRQENLQELMSSIQQFVDEKRQQQGEENIMLMDYLQEVAVLTDIEDSGDKGTDKLPLMTIHSAKGLEFRAVFIVGVEENLFPSPMAVTPRELEEERRLLYVAITRAKEQCYITYALNRYIYGRPSFDTPSRFLRELDPQFIQRSNTDRPAQTAIPTLNLTSSRVRTTPYSDTLHTTSTNARVPISSVPQAPVSQSQTAQGTLSIGSRINHSRFGIGTVTALNGKGLDAKATVQFDNVGSKTLLLRFAQFTII